MLVTISTILGMATGLVPDFLDFFRKKEDNKYQLELMKLQGQLNDASFANQKDLLQARYEIEQSVAIYNHDRSLDGGKFINALRASVRPVITYFFFMVFIFVKMVALYYGLMVQDLSVMDLLPVIWDEETSVFFGSLLGFWFGNRISEKRKKQI